MKLFLRTIELYGSPEQVKEYIPKIRDFDLIGGWGLTEKLNGSDASALTTSVKLVDGHYILNGNKRWIGNANKVSLDFL
jgi:acyl-CoA oxidase